MAYDFQHPPEQTDSPTWDDAAADADAQLCEELKVWTRAFVDRGVMTEDERTAFLAKHGVRELSWWEWPG